MKNTQVCENFVSGYKAKVKHLFCKEDNKGRLVLYSYGSHFPLCIKLNDCFILNSDGYSQTTARHKGDLCRAFGFQDIQDLLLNHDDKMVLLTTNKINDLLNSDVKSRAELIEKEI